MQLVILEVLCFVLRYFVDSAQELNTGETIGLHATGNESSTYTYSLVSSAIVRRCFDSKLDRSHSEKFVGILLTRATTIFVDRLASHCHSREDLYDRATDYRPDP